MSNNDSKALTGALRQYIHNNGSGFVFGYDINEADKAFNDLLSENLALNNLIYECSDNGEIISRYFEPYMKHFLDGHDKLAVRNAELEAAINEVIEDNLHLADGDNCTLIKLKRVLGM